MFFPVKELEFGPKEEEKMSSTTKEMLYGIAMAVATTFVIKMIWKK